jgi:hypothetical protein
VVAVDAGPMQIQLWGGEVLRRAKAGPRSATHRAGYREIEYSESVSRKLWLKRW